MGLAAQLRECAVEEDARRRDLMIARVHGPQQLVVIVGLGRVGIWVGLDGVAAGGISDAKDLQMATRAAKGHA